MLIPKRPMLALLLSPALLGGCAPSGSFPSLAPRAAERAAATPAQGDQAAAEPAPPAADAALTARLSRLVADARQGQQAFGAALVSAEGAIARAGAPRSESWIEAQLALSRLEAARSPSVTAQGDLDALVRERNGSGAPPTEADAAAITAAAEQIRALVAAQNEELARLSARLED
ncbi:hypothetical protein [Sphingomonas sp.]|uniref:hypothetical protein n=1 Tax=Sphingomonas sp. TaxID=28214 RepID=UPI002FC92795